MGTAFLHGNGGAGGAAALNFKVVAYESEEALLASSPAENTIGVITTTPITSWMFASVEPANPEAGMVFFIVGTESVNEFNALKKNSIQVYPLSAKQHVDGAFVDVTAKSYQNGAWVDWDKRYFFFKEGVGLSGGVNAYLTRPDPDRYGFSVSDQKIVVSNVSAETTRFYFDPKRDLTNFNTLHMEIQCGDRYNDDMKVTIGVGDDVPNDTNFDSEFDAKISGIYNVNRTLYSVDLSGVNGEKYIKILCPNVCTVLYNAWLE